MSTFMDEYRRWISDEVFDADTKAELLGIEGNTREIEDRFYKELEFGTAGLRGVVGAGANRMNDYTVGKVTQGLCDFIASEAGDGAKGRGVVIAYDPRRKSREFAEGCGAIIAANGIKAYLFDDIRPTPLLSFALRRLNCVAGIVITASHNPKEYNGFKVYGEDGAQMSVNNSNKVVEYTNRLQGYGDIKRIPFEEARKLGLLQFIGKEIDDEYIKNVRSLSLRNDEIRASGILKDFKVIYTPLHGTGNILVRRILSELGFENVLVVPEQEAPDPDFSTVESPNPENSSAFNMAIELAKKENVDIIIGTDPDCDRIGVVFKDYSGEYITLNGNQIGCLLMDYILSSLTETEKLPSKPFVVKSIVTSRLADAIANYYGVEIFEVFTGFKYICGLVKELDELGDRNFVYGFEESHGYVAGTFVRDKDGVIASMLVAEMAAFYMTKGMTFADVLKRVYEKYGHTLDVVLSYTLKGKEGQDKIAQTMKTLRAKTPAEFGGAKVRICKDYLTGIVVDIIDNKSEKTDLVEKSNVLSFEMEDGSWYVIRPSGTEPKIKLYFGVSGKGREEAEDAMTRFRGSVTSVIEGMLYS
ncbi:MAG: phospho-sugar mutase [Synergistaceae bacterium]|nr:phospho-sugar mutase [Synergistaceae bacterium]